MRVAGGIISVISGTFAVFAAATTLFLGGVGTAFAAEEAELVVGLGFGGLAAAFLVIVFGAMSIGVRRSTPGILTIITALVGAVVGGTLVALFMVLALIGGILAAIGGRASSRPSMARAETTA